MLHLYIEKTSCLFADMNMSELLKEQLTYCLFSSSGQREVVSLSFELRPNNFIKGALYPIGRQLTGKQEAEIMINIKEVATRMKEKK